MKRSRSRGRGAWVASLALGTVAFATAGVVPVHAQEPRLEVTASGGRWDGYDLGTISPSITGPQEPTGSPVLVLKGDARAQSGAAAELRLGWRLWRAVHAEATGGLARNSIEVRIHDDIEQAPATTVSASLLQITVEGGGLVELARVPMPSGRLVVFATGGGGYLRQVHEDRVLVETGSTIYGGAGVKWRTAPVQPRGLAHRMLLRGDVRLVTRGGGADTTDARRTYITVSGGVGLRLF